MASDELPTLAQTLGSEVAHFGATPKFRKLSYGIATARKPKLRVWQVGHAASKATKSSKMRIELIPRDNVV